MLNTDNMQILLLTLQIMAIRKLCVLFCSLVVKPSLRSVVPKPKCLAEQIENRLRNLALDKDFNNT